MHYNEDKFRACFLLAGLEYNDIYPIENGYCGNQCCPDKPWFLFATDFGIVKIGWRKKVINIDWSNTSLRTNITTDNVTKGESFVHAWSWSDCVKYLCEIRKQLKRDKQC